MSGQTGGTFSGDAGLVVDPSTGDVNLVTSTPVTHTVTYSFSNGNCQNTTTASIVINALPTISPITGATNICVGASTPYADNTAGGIWASSDNTIATVDLNGKVSGIAPGNATITYTITNNNNCTIQTQLVVTVNALPVVSPITGTTTVNAGSTTALSDATVSGTWSSSNNSVATVNSNGVVTGVNVGNAIISYTVTNNSNCSTSVTTTVTVNAAIDPITGVTTVCAGSTTTLSDATSGGTWSSSNTSVATINQNGVVTGISQGSSTITYSIDYGNNNISL